MPGYQLYGCHVQTSEAIAGLASSLSETVDISINFDVQLKPSRNEGQVVHRSEGLTVRRLESGYHFRYTDNTQFFVGCSGDDIVACTPVHQTIQDTITYLVGPVMGFVLRLRGVVCLHASTIVIGASAIVFCGPPGAGKSTTAAAFAKRKYTVLAEDVAALKASANSVYVQSGYPRVNLWPESVAALCGSEDALPNITPNWGKRYLGLCNESEFQTSSAPLAAVYILGDREHRKETRIERLRPTEGMIALAANTYTPYLLDQDMRQKEFAALSRIAAHVPIHRILPSDDIANIHPMCDAVLNHYGSLH